MGFRFRPWQLAAALILLCCLAVGAVYWFRPRVELDPKVLVPYLPQRAETVAYLDVRLLRASGLLNRLAGPPMAEEPEYKHFVAQTGFNYREDLDVVVMGLQADHSYFLLGGRFDWKQMIRYANSNGGNCWNGLCRVPSTSSKKHVSFRALDSRLMALAISEDDSAVDNIVKKKGPAPFAIPSDPVWASMPGAVMGRVNNYPPGSRPFVRALAETDRLLFTVGQKESRLELALDIQCKTPAQADVMKETMDRLTALVRALLEREKQKPNPADLSGLLTAGVFFKQDSHVLARWPLEQALLESIAGGGWNSAPGE